MPGTFDRMDILERLAAKVEERFLRRIDIVFDLYNNSTVSELKRFAKNEPHQLKLYRDFIHSFLIEYACMERDFGFPKSSLEKRAAFFRRLLPLIDPDTKKNGDTAETHRTFMLKQFELYMRGRRAVTAPQPKR